MRVDSWLYCRPGFIVMQMLLMTALLSSMTACGNRVPQGGAPERSFKPEDLLVGEEFMPSGWDSSGLVFPTGDDMATTESISQGYGTTLNGVRTGMSLQSVYRYISKEVARRKFEVVYLRIVQHKRPLDEWTFRSSTAQQTFFGCGNSPDGSGYLVCEWGGQYEEYITTLQMLLIPGEVSLVEMERIVQAIDQRISEYLKLTSADSG